MIDIELAQAKIKPLDPTGINALMLSPISPKFVPLVPARAPTVAVADETLGIQSNPSPMPEKNQLVGFESMPARTSRELNTCNNLALLVWPCAVALTVLYGPIHCETSGGSRAMLILTYLSPSVA